jgi:SAM-dependent methyltransferase
MFDPFDKYVGRIGPNDGSIDMYLRVQSLGGKNKTLLDLGAGRAAWFEDDVSDLRRNMRHMQGRFNEVIATDVDPVVRQNRASDRQIIMGNGRVPLDDSSVDVIVSDYVLEHISDPTEFAHEIDRLLVPGGWFCGRTPHKANYVVLASRIMPDRINDRVLLKAQPARKQQDVFPKNIL